LPENEQLIELLEAHVDWKRLSHLFSALEDTSSISENAYPSAHGNRALCVARNAESFSFIYQETLDRYRNTYFFDPETEEPGLNDIDLLYLPGGYPEKHLEALVANEAARTAIKAFAERGGNIIAECGGMMYLCEKIITDDGEYPMCGVLPYTISARTADRKLSLGYRQFTIDGKVFRGHEFHYTQFTTQPPSSVQVYNAKGEPVTTPVFRYKNVLASYTHLYWI
jgi:cobyrinic acid a,c-diamide synthase